MQFDLTIIKKLHMFYYPLIIFSVLYATIPKAVVNDIAPLYHQINNEVIIGFLLTIAIMVFIFYHSFSKIYFKDKLKKIYKPVILIVYCSIGFLFFNGIASYVFTGITSVPISEPLPFIPFLFIAIPIGLAALITFTDDMKHAIIFSITSFVIFIWFFQELVISWDIYLWAAASFSFSMVIPILFFRTERTIGITSFFSVLGTSFFSAVLITIYFGLVNISTTSTFPMLTGRIINIFWIMFIAIVLILTAFLVLHELLLGLFSRIKIHEPFIEYIRKDEKIDIVMIIEFIIVFLIGKVLFYQMSSYFIDNFNTIFLTLFTEQTELIPIFPFWIFVLNASILMIGTFLSYVRRLEYAAFFSAGGFFGLVLYYINDITFISVFLFGCLLLAFSTYILTRQVAHVDWKTSKYNIIFYTIFSSSLFFIIGLIFIFRSQLANTEILTIEVILYGILIWWYIFLSTLVIFYLSTLFHDYILEILGLERHRDDDIVQYKINLINTKKIGLYTLTALLSLFVFPILDYYSSYIQMIGLFLQTSPSPTLFFILSMLCSISLLLSYLGKKHMATFFSFIGFFSYIILILTNLIIPIRWDIYILALGSFFIACMLPAYLFHLTQSFKDALIRSFWSALGSTFFFVCFSIFYIASFTSDISITSSYLDGNVLFLLARYAFVFLFFSFIGIILFHEGLLYLFHKKRIIINNSTRYVAFDDVDLILQESHSPSESIISSIDLKKRITETLSPSITDTPDHINRCGVCIGKIKPGSSIIQCGHCNESFHESCAMRIKICPHCQSEIIKKSNDNKENGTHGNKKTQ